MTLAIVLITTFVVVQVAYLLTSTICLYLSTRPVDWVDPQDASMLSEEEHPPIVLLYPVLRELEETMRTTMLGIGKLDYPASRFQVIAIPNADDHETIASLTRLRSEFPFLDVLPVPPTSDAAWDVVWAAWEANDKAYWFHKG